MSGTYWLQSRIASGSQAARCCGVHCCALAGKDAHVSATPRSARAVTGRTFNAARIPTLVLAFCPSIIVNSTGAAIAAGTQISSLPPVTVNLDQFLQQRITPVSCLWTAVGAGLLHRRTRMLRQQASPLQLTPAR